MQATSTLTQNIYYVLALIKFKNRYGNNIKMERGGGKDPVIYIEKIIHMIFIQFYKDTKRIYFVIYVYIKTK